MINCNDAPNGAMRFNDGGTVYKWLKIVGDVVFFHDEFEWFPYGNQVHGIRHWNESTPKPEDCQNELLAKHVSSNKYEREITDRYGKSSHVDVYDVLLAFDVTCPATQHAIKKLLCSGIRGHKDAAQDLVEANESIVRAIELVGGK